MKHAFSAKMLMKREEKSNEPKLATKENIRSWGSFSFLGTSTNHELQTWLHDSHSVRTCFSCVCLFTLRGLWFNHSLSSIDKIHVVSQGDRVEPARLCTFQEKLSTGIQKLLRLKVASTKTTAYSWGRLFLCGKHPLHHQRFLIQLHKEK